MSYSQNLSITNVQRDSIFNKITRGNQAIEDNAILKKRIISKDSVFKIQTEIIGIQKIDLGLKDKTITNLNTVINNLNTIVVNEKKIGRRKGLFGILKGAVLGFLGAILILL